MTLDTEAVALMNARADARKQYADERAKQRAARS